MIEAALTLNRLALENIRRKPYRNLGLAVLTGIFAAIFFGGSLLNWQLSRGLESLAERLGADVLIVPYGHEQIARAALLRGEPGTYYMRREVLDKIRELPVVAAATPQFFLASLDTSCCTERVQIIGFDPPSDFLIHPWLGNKIARLAEGEVVAGAKIRTGVGEGLFFFGRTYRVAAKMEPTGMGLDTSIFMPLPAVYELMRDNPDLPQRLENPEEYISAVAIRANPDLSSKQAGNEILQAYAVEYNLDQIITENIINSTARRLHTLSSAVYLLAAGIWLLAVLVLSLVFSVSVSERKYELSLYRLLGAQRSWLASLLLREAFMVCAGGALAGILAAACIVFPFSALIFAGLQLPHLGLPALEAAGLALLTLALAGACGPLASLNTVFSLTRSDVYATLREGE
jgi:putative ABC transport system permease protein